MESLGDWRDLACFCTCREAVEAIPENLVPQSEFYQRFIVTGGSPPSSSVSASAACAAEDLGLYRKL